VLSTQGLNTTASRQNTAAHGSTEPVVVLEAIGRTIQDPGKAPQVLFQGLSLDLHPGERLAIFSTSKRETAHLLRCVAGVDTPERGRVKQNGTVSWPVGTDDALSSKLSGYENVRFALAIYGDPGRMGRDLTLIEGLSGITRERLHDPLSTYSGGQKTKLAMAIALTLRFDLYPIAKLPGIDLSTPSPQAQIFLDRFEGELAKAGLLLAGNDLWSVAESMCREGIVLMNGTITYRGDLEVCRMMVQEERERQREEQRQALLAKVTDEVLVDSVTDEDPSNEIWEGRN
jgi:capsular polysaccharide transport system ATP-binding protein